MREKTFEIGIPVDEDGFLEMERRIEYGICYTIQ